MAKSETRRAARVERRRAARARAQDDGFVSEPALTEEPDADETLTKLVDWFEAAEDQTSEERQAAERDRDYYDGKQLTQEEEQTLKLRGQPIVIDNRIKRKVDYLLGFERAQRTDPRAYPRNPDDEKAAEAATDAIRFVWDQTDGAQVASAVWENMMVEGIGATEVRCVHRDGGDTEIILTPVPWDRLFWDPHSRRLDFSDAKYIGTVAWMDEDDVLARWPESQELVEGAYSSLNVSSDTYDDRPHSGIWANAKRKRIRVSHIRWRKDGEWWTATYTCSGFFETPQVSPYTGERGEPECDLVVQASYLDRDNRHYGIVREMVSMQDAINKRHSKALHLLSVRQVVADAGAVLDVDEARKQLARPDGFIEVMPNSRFEIQSTTDLATGQMQLLQEAKQDMDLMGPNASMQGEQGNSASGRAIALSQQGGQMQIGPLMDAHRAWRKRVYRAIWNRIRQFWTAEKWIRVTDDERNMRFVALNKPMTLADQIAELPPHMQQQAIQRLQLVPNDPRLFEVQTVENNVVELDVDIIVDLAPDTVTLQSEQFEQLAGLAKMGVAIPPTALVKASSLRNKDQILEEMERAAQQAPPPNPQVMNVERQARKDEMDAVAKGRELQFKRESKAADVALATGDQALRRDQASAGVAMDAAQMFTRAAQPRVTPAA